MLNGSQTHCITCFRRATNSTDKGALDLLSPNLFWDGNQFVVTWSCTIAKNFIQAFQEDVENSPRIWYAMTNVRHDRSVSTTRSMI